MNLFCQVFLVLTVVFAPLYSGLSHAQASHPLTQWQMSPAPQMAPEAMWIGPDGVPHQLSEYRGNVVLLNVWATWCQPCLAEMPTLDKLQRRYEQAGLRIIPVALDSSGFAKMDLFYRQARIRHLPLAADPSGRLLGPLVADSKSIPTTYVIDRQGKLIGSVVGAEDWFSDNVKKLVEMLLRQEVLTPQEQQTMEQAPLILDVRP
ncbi:MAG: TlpA disulfide reductase family protein [Alphaproteobacteria bacterium]|nr:TlpA disulfide reductase family protein [Alphaproteobacteria bacterium]